MNTTNSLFIVRIYCDDATITVETNSAEVMLDHFNAALGSESPCEVICGTTGEILASHDCGIGDHATDAFVGLVLADAITQLME
jgi:hypothetical protein